MNLNMIGFAALFSAAVVASPASANFAVDTGMPLANDIQLSKSQSLAGYFTLASALEVSSVEGFISGLDSVGTITIYSDAAVPAASNTLFSANFAILSSAGAWQGVFGQKWKLAAGSYWVGFSNSGNGNFMKGFAPTPLPQYAFSTGSSWTLDDPSSAASAIGVRIDGNRYVAAVPEPASWTMMIAGFGAIGGVLRTRRRKAEVFLLAGAAGHGHSEGGLSV
ncbi:PEPxxWA-CTERM sorting domain-containing protein [Phenylobacterium sp.]|uniref:PEPxxWA-CTERM sorting domain-containing protein n=1 Tax=Phenylobacterium sp. TaxID=1871053 RepID=UPI0025D93EC5|nr:PEPxxWA-CTERM sorting domain-containing protein [Phenylobacterium sp.]